MSECVERVAVMPWSESHSVARRSSCQSMENCNEETVFADWWRAFSCVWDRTGEVVLLNSVLTQADTLDGRVVDVGCGDMALFSRGFLPLPRRYVGVEPNPCLLASARKQFPHVALKSSRGGGLPCDSRCADLVLCLWVLHISDEIPQILSECRRIARSGATVLMAVPDLQSQLYHTIYDLAGRLFPNERIADPDALLREQHAAILAGLEGSRYVVTHFSGSVILSPEPHSRILPLIDFVQWLMPNGPTLNEVLRTVYSEREHFVSLPSRLEDKGLLIKAVLD